MKKLRRSLLLIGIAAMLLAACGKKEVDILPFSSLTPGRTVEEVSASEPGESVSDTVYIVRKEYNGMPLYATFDDARPGNGVIWNAYEDEGDLDKLTAGIKKYCDKNYKLIEESERDGTTNTLWETGEYSVFMQDFVKGGKRQVDISVLRN